MKTIIFATNNDNKVREIKSSLQTLHNNIEIITLRDAGINIEIEEPFDTLEENAHEKAIVISSLSGKDCFSEDTGLFVNALDGKPGVKSARYSGENATGKKNIVKLLESLNSADRSAYFKTIICYLKNGDAFYFEGICNGSITMLEQGTEGFGYDSVFVPDGSDKTFAQMTMEEKNKFSHRKKALDKFILFLQDDENY